MLSKKLSYIKFYWEERLNKFSLVLYSTGRGSPSLFPRNLSAILDRGFSQDFPWILTQFEDPRKPDEDMDCKEANAQPRSISPVLKGTWEGLCKLYLYNWDLQLKVRIFEIYRTFVPTRKLHSTNRKLQIWHTPPFVFEVDVSTEQFHNLDSAVLGKHKSNSYI